MPFKVPCACGKTLLLKDEWAGRKVRCSGCKQILLAAQPAAAKPDEDPPEVDVTELAVTAAPPKRTPAQDVNIEDDDRPWSKSKKRRAEEGEGEEEDNDRPRSRSKRRRDDDDEDDDRPRSRSKRRRDDDDDDEDDDRPRSKSRRRPSAPDQQGTNTTANGSIGMGVLMMVGAIVWFIGGLAVDVFFIYPPILFVLGIIATFRGAMQRE